MAYSCDWVRSVSRRYLVCLSQNDEPQRFRRWHFWPQQNKARVFMPNEIQTRFSDVAGATEAKEALQDIIDYLKYPEKYKRSGAHVPRGVLFIGEPEMVKRYLQKHLLARRIAHFFQLPVQIL